MKSYEQALDRYTKAYQPPRSKKWKEMADNARPLGRVGEYHKSIHKTADGVIYYRLYDTNILTLHPRDTNGEYKVEFRYYQSQTTDKFIYDYGLYCDDLRTTEDKIARVPRVHTWAGHSPTATLTLDANDKLIVSKSSHLPIYTAVMSDDDKVGKKMLKEKLEPLVTLAMFKLADYKANVSLDVDLGAPFSGATWGRRYAPNAVVDLERYAQNKRITIGEIDEYLADPEFVEMFMAASQVMFDVLASKRVYAADGFFDDWSVKKNPELIEKRERIQAEVVASITPEDFRKTVFNRMVGLFKVENNGRKDWGQFKESLPRKWYTR